MYSPSKKPKPYSQLAAIQLGFLRKQGAVVWREKQPAASGKDTGCFDVVPKKFHPAATRLMRIVGGIKARGDKRGAAALVKEFVDAGGQTARLLELIKERWLRAPKASFVYAIEP
jgi:hypothetical protein